MAGRPTESKLNALAGSEGDDFDPEDLEFGEVDENLPADEEVLASAGEGEESPEEQSTEGDEPAEEEDEIEYEEDDEGGDETPAPESPAPTPPAAAPAASDQPAASAAAAPAPQKVLHELLLEHEGALVENLAKSTFKLQGKDAEMFDDDGVRHFIAKNNATVFVKTMASVSQWLHAALPAAVENLTRVNSDVQTHENQFLKENPDLGAPGIKERLGTYAQLVRQQQPNLNRAQLAAETARVARALHNLPQPRAKAPGQQQQTQQKPKVKTVSRMPFRPAGSGAPRSDNGKAPKKDPLQALNDMLRLDFD